jgi:hypothetical protein
LVLKAETTGVVIEMCVKYPRGVTSIIVTDIPYRYRAGRGGPRTTARHGGQVDTPRMLLYCLLSTIIYYYGMKRAMPVAGPLPFPTITGVWERRRGVGRRIGRNIDTKNKNKKGLGV